MEDYSEILDLKKSEFDENDNLIKAVIKEGITKIGDCVFSHCIGLTTVVIPDSIVEIGDLSFSGCTGLEKITIGNGVAHIGSNAFSGCSELASIHISDIAAWCKIVFDTPSSNPLYYADYFYVNNTKVSNLIIPNGVTAIGNYAFKNCFGLTSVTIPDSVTSIGQNAFENCTGLTNIVLSNGITTIGDFAFYYCTGLMNITIPDTVTDIGHHAFYDCKNLRNIEISNNIAYIGYCAFSKSLKLFETTKNIRYKITDENMRCRGFQYSLNKIFEMKDNIFLGHKGFHSCKRSINCFNSYYGDVKKFRFWEVEISGKTENKNGITCSEKIKFLKELTLSEFISKSNT